MDLQIEELLDSYKNSNDEDELWISLTRILSLNMVNDHNVQTVISFINKLLSSAVNRSRGFTLLNKILPYCSKELLSEKSILWVNCCVTYNHKHELSVMRFQCLSKFCLSIKFYKIYKGCCRFYNKIVRRNSRF